MNDPMEILSGYVTTPECRAAYPKLRSALKSLNELVGMDDIKHSIANSLMRCIAFDMLDRQELGVPRITRSQTKKPAKRKRKAKGWSRKKKRQQMPRAETKTKIKMAVQDQLSSVSDFLQTIEIQLQDEDDDEFEVEEEISIRSKRLVGMRLHTLLLGAAGCGKTTLARKLHGLWNAVGLVNDKFFSISKDTISSVYQGGALQNIQELISNASNGVIFLDECYSLVQGEKDSYGNEVLAAIVSEMTRAESTITWIFAGYEKDVQRNLFGANSGLERRFANIFLLKKPSESEMAKIFGAMLRRQKGWRNAVSLNELEPLFAKHKHELKFGGGSVENLVASVLDAHVQQNFPLITQRICINDVVLGLNNFKKKNNKTVDKMCSFLYT